MTTNSAMATRKAEVASDEIVGSDLRVRALSHSLHGWGWECLQADIDLVARKARVVLRSYMGRVVTLDAKSGLNELRVGRREKGAGLLFAGLQELERVAVKS